MAAFKKRVGPHRRDTESAVNDLATFSKSAVNDYQESQQGAQHAKGSSHHQGIGQLSEA